MSVTTLADIVLLVHACVVLFIVGGFVAILIGHRFGWPWVRSPVFRFAHLCAIGIVALLALFDVPCPLTWFEGWLRQDRTMPQGWVAYWVARLLYYDLPTWVFTAAYVAFALAVLVAWRFVPPRTRR
ncbi:DUF2784 domain-containing protein [Trinickia caryophylli]|uniref:DUF2784 domain-containing protein n=1 Tax=Trinickia caryophylli TaxID=28094 RepID=A0A1X7GNW0_TRICW|nr:DUF2784 domain-containing protein [Trinickia caryophylli]PMS10480.1 DUF2784 domain-containing protein [Trinickia caryophylli]TRX19127.1 DUF2784 domain-containing protein [Trinickia caryophylli]WQE13577.1 DUF2784 domain-containing protein [Trinickia caryophylli]SMF72542.1 Protein of Unknown function [Trinickia caryophylli]GLU35090.1 hypothetical protein Busp01_49320 [Trinickia caryophylli]